jgi:flagellin-specific chaperone FliS
VSELGIEYDGYLQVVSRASEYERETRSSEKPFHISRVMAIIEDLKPGLMKEDKTANTGLEAATNYVNVVMERTSKLLQLASEAENVQKGNYQHLRT